MEKCRLAIGYGGPASVHMFYPCSSSVFYSVVRIYNVLLIILKVVLIICSDIVDFCG